MMIKNINKKIIIVIIILLVMFIVFYFIIEARQNVIEGVDTGQVLLYGYLFKTSCGPNKEFELNCCLRSTNENKNLWLVEGHSTPLTIAECRECVKLETPNVAYISDVNRCLNNYYKGDFRDNKCYYTNYCVAQLIAREGFESVVEQKYYDVCVVQSQPTPTPITQPTKPSITELKGFALIMQKIMDWFKSLFSSLAL